MKKKLFPILVLLLVGLIVIFSINLVGSSPHPRFSKLKDNDVKFLQKNEILYYGNPTCQACQEFNKILETYQDESKVKIYYWESTNSEVAQKAAELKVYKTPTIIIKNKKGRILKIEGYHSLKRLKKLIKEYGG